MQNNKIKYLPARKLKMSLWDSIAQDSYNSDIFFQWWYLNLLDQKWGAIIIDDLKAAIPILHSSTRKLINNLYFPYTSVLSTTLSNSLNFVHIKFLKKNFFRGKLIIDKSVKISHSPVSYRTVYYMDLIDKKQVSQKSKKYYTGRKIKITGLAEWLKENRIIKTKVELETIISILKIAGYKKHLIIRGIYSQTSHLKSVAVFLVYKKNMTLWQFWSTEKNNANRYEQFNLCIEDIIDEYAGTNRIIKFYNWHFGLVTSLGKSYQITEIKLNPF